MKAYAWLNFANSFLTFCLFLFIIFKARDRRLSKRLGAFLLSVSLWGFGVGMHALTKDPYKALFWSRFLHLGAVPLPAFYYIFIRGLIKRSNPKATALLLGLAGLFLVLIPTHSFIQGVSSVGPFLFFPKAGPIYGFYILFFFTCVSLGCYQLLRTIPKTRGVEQDRLQLVFWGPLLGFLFGPTAFLPMFNIPVFPFGTPLVVLNAAIITYAIVKKELLDVHVAIKKTIIFAGLSIFVLAIMLLASYGLQGILSEYFGLPKILSSLLGVVVIILSYEKVKDFLVRVTDRVLFQRKFDYKHILNSYIEGVAVELNLEKVSEATVRVINQTMRPKSIYLFLFNPERGEFVAYSSSVPMTIAAGSPLVKALREEKKPMFDGDPTSPSYGAVGEMRFSGARVAVPLLMKDELLGFMLLGEKMSDENYSHEDLLILTDMAKTESIAIKNARYVEQLNAASHELARAQVMKQIADMADGMSHQFNNRFFSISSPLGLLRKQLDRLKIQVQTADSETKLKLQSSFLEMAGVSFAKAEANAVRGGDLAKGLLRYSRPEKAGFQMHNISDNVTLSLEMLGYKHEDLPALEIQHKFDPGVPKTWANASYLQDLFFILLDNSYDAIKQKEQLNGDYKGVISIHVGADSLGESIEVTIKDNGIGMKPEILEKVRAAIPYVTTKPSSSEKSGYGSGVQVLNRLVDLHGGRIQYDSVYMEGTQVVIKFPVRLPVVKS